MKIELIAATSEETRPRNGKIHKWSKALVRYSQLTLTTIAALTPPGIDINLTDETFEPVNFDSDADLIGITALTASAPRAYEIADEFRKRGKTVILGGIHPSMLPDEAKQHADSVVVGEAEGTWQKLIADYQNNNLQPFYYTPKGQSLAGLPIPRRDLLKKNAYFTVNTMQASRGCYGKCEFCSISKFTPGYRWRPIPEVIEEIKTLDGNLVAFVDDNIAANHNQAEELFTAMIPLKKKWYGLASMDLARDEKLLSLAKESGCKGLVIGFDSISNDSLKIIGKTGMNRVKEYNEVIQKFHKHGIAVVACFVFGFDGDKPDIFENTLRFSLDSGLDIASYNVLVPYPGTPLYDRLKAQGRITETDWSKYIWYNVCFEPLNMSAEMLLNGTMWARNQFFTYRSMIRRMASLKKKLGTWEDAKLIWSLSLNYRRRTLSVPVRGYNPARENKSKLHFIKKGLSKIKRNVVRQAQA